MAQGEWREIDGQWWWYQFTNGQRSKGDWRDCERCGKRFLIIPSRKTRLCSVQCASWLPRPRKPTEGIVLDLTQAIAKKRSDSTRFAPDQHGVVWEVRQDRPFTRATMVQCAMCGKTFPRRKSARHRFCSYSCSRKSQPTIVALPGVLSIDREGYVWVTTEEGASGAVKRSHGWAIKEHRKVMADMLGRPLLRNENVHHKDGDRANNDPSNLELWVKTQPAGQRSTEIKHCPTCTCNNIPMEVN